MCFPSRRTNEMATFIKQLRSKSTSNPSRDCVDPAPLYVAMAAGEQKQKNKGGGGDDGDEKGEGGQKLEEKGEELKEEMDNLLDEIDSVLEENAEEFVKNYVQRGGE
jgi:prokaryotic ubiquitin-like protein Pup